MQSPRLNLSLLRLLLLIAAVGLSAKSYQELLKISDRIENESRGNLPLPPSFKEIESKIPQKHVDVSEHNPVENLSKSPKMEKLKRISLAATNVSFNMTDRNQTVAINDSPPAPTELTAKRIETRSTSSAFSFTLNNRNRTVVTIHSPPASTEVYCSVRSDRAGAALWDYFHAHAFAFRHGLVFGGACGMATHEPFASRQLGHRQLVEDLGLKAEIPVLKDCPPSSETLQLSLPGTTEYETNNATNSTTKFLLPPSAYLEWDGLRSGSDALTPLWVKSIRNSLHQKFLARPSSTESSNKTTTIVVHIRRGDVHPCDLYTRERYMTNQYYMDWIKAYITSKHEHYHVIIHSQKLSFEPWSEFETMVASLKSLGFNLTYEMKLDVPIDDVWLDVVSSANVFVMSKSSFSQTAAILMGADENRTVVCMPFPGCNSLWHRVNHTVIRTEKLRMESIVESQCQNITYDSRKMSWDEKKVLFG